MPKIIQVRPNGTKRVATVSDKPSRADQQWKDSCDVNKIMEKYRQTGTITHVRNAKEGKYLDLTSIPTYQEALDQIRKADSLFQEIPAKIRLKFDNNPQKLIDYLADEKNLAESIELGLRVPKPQDPVVEELKALNSKISQPQNPDKSAK